MAPQPFPIGTTSTPSTHLASHQKVKGRDRLLFAFIDWLLPHLRLRTAQASRRWDNFWLLFKTDGTLGWREFERFMRWDCKLNAQKIFEALDDDNTGTISSRAVLDVRRQYERLIDCRHMGLDDLRYVLVRKYGSLMRAWRCLFDPDLRGRLSHTTFMKCCREVGFHGDLKLAWWELTGGDVHRTATSKDLDPKGDLMMLQFVTALGEHHETPEDGWHAILRNHGTHGRMPLALFEIVCSDLRFSKKFANEVFGMLDVNLDRALSLQEWDFMALWAAGFAKEGRPSKADTADTADTKPKAKAQAQAKKGVWQLVVSGRLDNESISPGYKSETGTVEFHVVMTNDEHREYLKRLWEAEMAAVPKKVGRKKLFGAASGLHVHGPHGNSGDCDA